MNTSWGTAAVYAAWIVVAAAFYTIDQYAQTLHEVFARAARFMLGARV